MTAGVSSPTHGVFIGGCLSEPLSVIKVLKKLELSCVQAATAVAGGPVWRMGPDFRQVSGMRRKASKSRKRAASASLTRVRVVAPAAEADQGVRLGPGGQQDQQGAGDLDEVEPAQQGDAAALPHGPQAIDHLKIAEQGFRAPPVGICLNDGWSGQRGIG